MKHVAPPWVEGTESCSRDSECLLWYTLRNFYFDTKVISLRDVIRFLIEFYINNAAW